MRRDDFHPYCFETHTEEECDKYCDDSNRQKPSSGCTILSLPIVSKERRLAEKIRFSKNIVEIVEARWHKLNIENSGKKIKNGK